MIDEIHDDRQAYIRTVVHSPPGCIKTQPCLCILLPATRACCALSVCEHRELVLCERLLPGKFHKHGNLDADGKSFCPLVMMAERAIKRIFHFESCGVGFVSLVSADMQTETACFG